jgi:hypothetical protein
MTAVLSEAGDGVGGYNLCLGGDDEGRSAGGIRLNRTRIANITTIRKPIKGNA